MLGQCKASLRELQQISGHLNFATKVMALGQAFSNMFCDAMKGLKEPYHRVRVNGKLKADSHKWISFLKDFNVVSFWHENLKTEPVLHVYSDTVGSSVFGVYFQGHWCAESWPDDWGKWG